MEVEFWGSRSDPAELKLCMHVTYMGMALYKMLFVTLAFTLYGRQLMLVWTLQKLW